MLGRGSLSVPEKCEGRVASQAGACPAHVGAPRGCPCSPTESPPWLDASWGVIPAGVFLPEVFLLQEAPLATILNQELWRVGLGACIFSTWVSHWSTC